MGVNIMQSIPKFQIYLCGKPAMHDGIAQVQARVSQLIAGHCEHSRCVAIRLPVVIARAQALDNPRAYHCHCEERSDVAIRNPPSLLS